MRSVNTERKKRTGRSRRPEPDPAGSVTQFVVRVGAVAALVALAALMAVQAEELRGELAFARLRYVGRLAEKTREPRQVGATLQLAVSEAELVQRFAAHNPDALWEVTIACGRWASRQELDSLLRLRLAEMSARASALGVRAAPSDYEGWFYMAAAYRLLGLAEPGRLAMQRARELAPPGAELHLPGL